MREPWVAYVVVGAVCFLMLLGKNMMYFSKKKDKKDD